MTYLEVLEGIKMMADAGNFNFIEYLNLIEQNNFAFIQFVFCYSTILSIGMIGIGAIVKYVKYVIKEIKYEIEYGE